MNARRLALILAALGVSPVAALNAQTLDSFSSANAEVQGRYRSATPPGSLGGRPTGPGTAILGPSPYDDVTGTSTAFFGSTQIAPFVLATASIGTPSTVSGAGDGVLAHAEVTYAFSVLGTPLQAGRDAFIDLSAIGKAWRSTSAGYGYATADLNLADITGGGPVFFSRQAYLNCSFGTACSAPNGFLLSDQQVTVKVGHIIGVWLATQASASSPLGQDTVPGTIQALLDPIFRLNPIQFEPGLTLSIGESITQPVGPLPGVPEPASYLLFLLGIGSVAVVMGGRKNGFGRLKGFSNAHPRRGRAGALA